MRNPKIGDIIEISDEGLTCYAVFVYKKKGWGELLWVYFDRLPKVEDFQNNLSKFIPNLIVFFPLTKSLKLGLVRIIGHAELIESQKMFPIFRMAASVKSIDDSEPHWWLWDGEKEWFTGSLSRKEAEYPIRQSVNKPFIISMLRNNKI